MKAEIIIPKDRIGHWGGPDLRPRCTACQKVAFADRDAARQAALSVTNRGTKMRSYRGRCGNFHVTRVK